MQFCEAEPMCSMLLIVFENIYLFSPKGEFKRQWYKIFYDFLFFS